MEKNLHDSPYCFQHVYFLNKKLYFFKKSKLSLCYFCEKEDILSPMFILLPLTPVIAASVYNNLL